MRIMVLRQMEDGKNYETVVSGEAHVESVVDDETEYLVTTESGREFLVQAPSTQAEIEQYDREVNGED